jgi:quercetin dioxygenase-like cupin family protein
MTAIPNIHLPSNSGKSFWGPGGDRYRFLITGETSGDSCFIVECLVPPGGGPPMHIHHREDECFYLMEGELEIEVGGKTIAVRSGDFVHAPKGVPHTYRNTGSCHAKMMVTFTPAGMEGWFETTLVPVRENDEAPPAPNPAMIQRMLDAGPEFGVEW